MCEWQRINNGKKKGEVITKINLKKKKERV